jgi:flagellar secretion chaperone FliS
MNGLDQYRNNVVTTQTPGTLIVMLYEGAIRFLEQSLVALEARQPAEKGRCVVKAIDILEELNLSLDVESGGQIAENLRRLYGFMIRHLTQAHAQNDGAKIREVVELLRDLNEGWKAVTS